MKIPKEEDINNVLAGESTPETGKEVAAWFATAEGASYLESQIMSDFEDPVIINDSEILKESIPSEEIFKQIQGQIVRKKLFRTIGKIAAIFFPFLLLVSSLTFLNTRIDLFGDIAYEEIYVPKGNEMQIIFQDGSKVYLDSDTRLKYPKKFAFGKREVYLDGQGYFEVNSNKNWPFIVNLSGPSIKVLGTSFNVNAYSGENNIIVRLDEGRIRMKTYSDLSYDLNPGDILTYDKLDHSCLIKSQSDNFGQKHSDFSNKEIVFNNSSLNEVTKILNRKFNVDFEFDSTKLNDIRFTISFKNNNIQEILSELEKISTLTFQPHNTDKTIQIKSK